MTATARVVITDALYLLRVIAEEETPQATALTDGLRFLNRRLHALKTKNADLDYEDITLDDDIPVPVELEDAVTYYLAATLGAIWGKQLTPEVAVEAKEALPVLQAYYRRMAKLKVDGGIYNRLGRYSYNINSDS